MTDLARQIARAIRDDLAQWVYMTAHQSKRIGGIIRRHPEGPVLAYGLRQAELEWRHELTLAECRARGQAFIDGLLPKFSGLRGELRLLLSTVPGYEPPVCKKCGPVTAATKCYWTACPMAGGRDWLEV